MLGDAMHAMVPYISQGMSQDSPAHSHIVEIVMLETGAAMALRMERVLAETLSNVTAMQDLKSALKVFENVRMRRAGQMQHASLINGMLWNFPD